MAFAAPRLTMTIGVNTMAARAYATKKLFIGNLPWGTTDDEVREFFAQYGELKDFHAPKDNMGRTKGFAFVELEDFEAEKALQDANGREFNGRELRIDFAAPRPEREFRPRREFNDRDGGERQYRPRRDFNDREGGERQFRPRRDFDGGERQYRPRRDNGEGGERSFRPRRDDSRDRE
ncbi:hypothetical protein BGZ79_010235 [Entomortierella chlamydospora]|nr:hypothetical protein BGZ79_010235 [Entomortierella chlamydospora]